MIDTKKLKYYLRLPDEEDPQLEEFLTICITNADALINTIAGRKLEKHRTTEIFSGDGGKEKWISEFPIMGILQLKYRENDSQDWSLDLVSNIANDTRLYTNLGRLFLINDYTFYKGTNNILLQYDAGFGTYGTTQFPGDLVSVCYEISAYFYLNSRVDWFYNEDMKYTSGRIGLLQSYHKKDSHLSGEPPVIGFTDDIKINPPTEMWKYWNLVLDKYKTKKI